MIGAIFKRGKPAPLKAGTRWVVERTLEWLRRDRRLGRDYERKVPSSETLIEVAMIRLILRRLARQV